MRYVIARNDFRMQARRQDRLRIRYARAAGGSDDRRELADHAEQGGGGLPQGIMTTKQSLCHGADIRLDGSVAGALT